MRIESPRQRLLLTCYLVGVAVFVSMMWLSSLVNDVPGRGLVVGGQYLFALTVLLWLCVSARSEDLRNGILAFSFAVALNGILAFMAVTNITIATVVVKAPIDFGRRSGGFLGNPNALGKEIALCVPLLVTLWSRSRPARRTLFTALFAIGGIAGMLAAASIGAVLTMAAGAAGLVMGIEGGYRRVRIVLATTLALGLAVVVVSSLTEIPQSFQRRILALAVEGNLQEADSYQIRRELLARTLIGIAERPVLGRGSDESRQLNDGMAPHNTFLAIWAEGGIVALTAFVAAGCSALLTLVGSAGPRDSMMRGVALSFSAMYLMTMLTSNHLYNRHLVLPLFLAVGVAVHGYFRLHPSRDAADQRIVRRRDSAHSPLEGGLSSAGGGGLIP